MLIRYCRLQFIEIKSEGVINYLKELSKYEIASNFNKEGLELCDNEEYHKGIEKYKKILELNPKCAEAYFNIGNAYQDLGSYEEAFLCFDEAIKLNPNDADFFYNKGLVLTKLGRMQEAKRCFDEYRRLLA